MVIVNIKQKNILNLMKKLNTWALILVVLVSFSSCQVIGGILKIGFVGGVIAVLVVVFIIIWIISLFRKSG